MNWEARARKAEAQVESAGRIIRSLLDNMLGARRMARGYLEEHFEYRTINGELRWCRK